MMLPNYQVLWSRNDKATASSSQVSLLEKDGDVTAELRTEGPVSPILFQKCWNSNCNAPSTTSKHTKVIVTQRRSNTAVYFTNISG